MPMVAPSTPPAKPPATRAFGRFELRRLLGKSDRTMAWLAYDPRLSQEVMLSMPRVQPADAAALEAWQRDVKLASRLNHPNLAHVVEVGVQDHWPYVSVDRALGTTLAEWLEAHPDPTPVEVVECLCQALRGLAFVHEAGQVHHDVQLHNLLVSDQGQVRLMALAVAGEPEQAPGPGASAHDRTMPVDAGALRQRRDSAERDLLACGIVLHRLLAGAPALDETDTSRVIERMTPLGRDLVRLPWSTPLPIPEALRAIVNRCTASQERQRYRVARTLLRALEGWRAALDQDGGGPLALLLDRLRTVGHLPALPGVSGRVARLSATEGQRTDEMAEQILQDMALSLEVLRNVNSAMVQGTQVSGSGPVLTIRRAIALIGVDGVRAAANSLRAWPGPMSDAGATALRRLMERVRLAGHAAQALRPAGYDPEVVYLIAVLQNLGRLLVQYHFPDEAEQIRQLMQPAPPSDGAEPGAPEQPGMSEEAASYAVLGVGIDALGAAVARHWGLGDEMQSMMRRLPPGKAVRTPDGDAALLRIVASAANEAVDTMSQLPAPRVGPALVQIAQRHARVLALTAREFGEALQGARAALQSGSVADSMKARGSANAATPVGAAA